MKKVLLLITSLFSLGVFAQVNVDKDYTKPFFQSNVKVSDTLGTQRIEFDNKLFIVDSLFTFDKTNRVIGFNTNDPFNFPPIYGGDATYHPRFVISTASQRYGLSHTDGIIEMNTYIDSNPGILKGGWFGTTSNHDLVLMTNDLGKFSIDTNGAVLIAPIGISAVNPSALLEMQSTTKGFLQPRMTTVQRDAIVSPVSGLSIFNNTVFKPNFYNGSEWEEVTTTKDYNEGKVKVNGHMGIQPSYTLAINTDQIVYYGTGIGSDTLNLSTAPTTEWPQNISTPVDSNLYNASDSTFYENFVLGQTHLWRVILDYSGKSTNDNVGLNVLLRNTLSGFESNATLTLPSGRTSDTDQQALILTIADDASLPPPFGTGVGYQLVLNCNKAITVTVKSVARISQQHSERP